MEFTLMKDDILYILFCLCILGSCTQLQAQMTSWGHHNWIGHWNGSIEIFSKKQNADTIKMSLSVENIDNTDSLSWTIVFDTGKDIIEKPYYIVADSSQSNLYYIDERNSIVLKQYLLGPNFVNAYQVMEHNYLVNYQLLSNKKMLFSIFVIPAEVEGQTGGGVHEGQTIPTVENYRVKMIQQGTLIKRDEH